MRRKQCLFPWEEPKGGGVFPQERLSLIVEDTLPALGELLDRGHTHTHPCCFELLSIRRCGSLWGQSCKGLAKVPDYFLEKRRGRRSVFSPSKHPLALVIRRQPMRLLWALTSLPFNNCDHTRCVSWALKDCRACVCVCVCVCVFT